MVGRPSTAAIDGTARSIEIQGLAWLGEADSRRQCPDPPNKVESLPSSSRPRRKHVLAWDRRRPQTHDGIGAINHVPRAPKNVLRGRRVFSPPHMGRSGAHGGRPAWARFCGHTRLHRDRLPAPVGVRTPRSIIARRVHWRAAAGAVLPVACVGAVFRSYARKVDAGGARVCGRRTPT